MWHSFCHFYVTCFSKIKIYVVIPDFDLDSGNMDGMLIIGQSTTWPTDIYVKKYGQTLR